METRAVLSPVEKSYHVSSEALVGIAVGCFVILALAQYSLGGALVRVARNFDPPSPPYSENPAFLIVWLTPALLIGVVGYIQLKASNLLKHSPGEKATRLALWLNALASLGFCLMVAFLAVELKVGGAGGATEADGILVIAVAVASFVALLSGILLSIFNIVRSRKPGSANEESP